MIVEKIMETLTGLVKADPYGSDGKFATQIRRLDKGLRAMAATHWLDVSLTLDGLHWHFLNFGEENHVQETEKGLRLLGLIKLADVFKESYQLMRKFLPDEEGKDVNEYLEKEGIEERIDELNDIADELNKAKNGESAIYASWANYARENPGFPPLIK